MTAEGEKKEIKILTLAIYVKIRQIKGKESSQVNFIAKQSDDIFSLTVAQICPIYISPASGWIPEFSIHVVFLFCYHQECMSWQNKAR